MSVVVFDGEVMACDSYAEKGERGSTDHAFRKIWFQKCPYGGAERDVMVGFVGVTSNARSMVEYLLKNDPMDPSAVAWLPLANQTGSGLIVVPMDGHRLSLPYIAEPFLGFEIETCTKKELEEGYSPVIHPIFTKIVVIGTRAAQTAANTVFGQVNAIGCVVAACRASTHVAPPVWFARVGGELRLKKHGV